MGCNGKSFSCVLSLRALKGLMLACDGIEPGDVSAMFTAQYWLHI